HTKANRMSIGHSSSAYSLVEVYPRGNVMAADKITSCHPQKLNLLKKSLAIRALSKRCKEWYTPAKMALPTNAKTTTLVCNGRSRPKLNQEIPSVSCGKTKRKASSNPTPIPKTPQNMV